MKSYKEIQAQIDLLSQQAEAQRKVEISAVIVEIKAKMNEYGLTVADLMAGEAKSGRARSKTAGVPVPPKYRDPMTQQTWSGRGKLPTWLAAHVAAGKAKDAFLIPVSA